MKYISHNEPFSFKFVSNRLQLLYSNPDKIFPTDNQYQIVGKMSNRLLSYTFGVYHNDTAVAIVTLHRRDIHFQWNIGIIWVKQEYRKQKIMTSLFKLIITEHGYIISGGIQNNNSKGLYQYFKENEPEYKVHSVKMKGRNIEILEEDTDMWDGNKHVRFVITHKSHDLFKS